MTSLQAIVMAVLQGVTELFPISSLGHAVILPAILHWAVDQKAADWLAYLVVMHLGTAIALFIYFWRDWLAFILSLVSRSSERVAADRRIFLMIVLATIPAAIIGLLLRKKLGEAFGTPSIAAIFLIVNGFILFFGDKIGGKAVGTLDQLNWKGALAIGFAQASALIPGISRSGATIVGGVVAGLQHKEAARFSFLLGIPAIALAGFKEVWELHKAHLDAHGWSVLAVGLAVASVSAFAAIWGLMRILERFSAWPFVIYRAVLGIGLLLAVGAGWLR